MQKLHAKNFNTIPHNADAIASIFLNIFLGQTVLYAHQKNLFAFLHLGPANLAAIAQHLQISPRAAQAVVSACCALKLVTMENETFKLTSIAETYLLQDSPFFYGGVLDDLVENNFMTSLDTIRNALETDRPQICSDNHFEAANQDPAMAAGFLKLMHSKSTAPAIVWPGMIDLNDVDTILDIGSGAGTHAIYACRHWPHLKAILFDLKFACQGAKTFIASHKLQARICTVIGDMWTDPFPKADVHFYSDILHDWPLERGQFLLQKSYDALPTGGRIVIHERLFTADKSGPLSTAAYNVMMMLWTTGQQLSQPELWEILTTAGFTHIETRKTTGDWSITVGQKF